LQSDGVSKDVIKESVWQYQGSTVDDWEKDLINDDDDKLADTLKKYAKDATVKGKVIVPTPQSNSEFNEDYPKDTEGPIEPANPTNKTGPNPTNPFPSDKQAKESLNSSENGEPNVTIPSSLPTDSPRQLNPTYFNKERAKTQVRAARKAVEAFKKELEDAKAKAEQAHASVLSHQSSVTEKNKSIVVARKELDLAATELSKCHEKESKLEIDILITKQAKAALLARLEMLQKENVTASLKVQAANASLVAKEAAVKEAKKKFDVATKEQKRMEKKQEAAKEALQNATDVLQDKNQTLIQSINAANTTFDRREEARKRAKQGPRQPLPFPS